MSCPRCLKGNLVHTPDTFTGYSCLACSYEPKPEGWVPPEYSPDLTFRTEKDVDLDDYEF